MRLKKLVFTAIAALAVVLAVNAPSQARGVGGHGSVGGHGFAGGHPGDADMHRDFDGRHGFDRGVHSRFLFGGPVYPYYGSYEYYPPAYGYPAPTYWYYCPSYEAYYPNVTSCPETWVPVSAS
jgi:hypothetical protein